MVEEIKGRISKKLKKAIEQDAKQKGIDSLNEYYTKALEHFLTCNKFEPSMKLREWLLNYDDTCRKCKRTVKAGEWALWGKDAMGNSIVICMDCYITRVGDKATVAKFMKIREWNYTLKALKKECERYAQEHENNQLRHKREELEIKNAEVNKLILQYITAKVGTSEEQRAWEEIIRKHKEEDELMNNIKEFLQKLKARRKKGMKVYA